VLQAAPVDLLDVHVGVGVPQPAQVPLLAEDGAVGVAGHGAGQLGLGAVVQDRDALCKGDVRQRRPAGLRAPSIRQCPSSNASYFASAHVFMLLPKRRECSAACHEQVVCGMGA